MSARPLTLRVPRWLRGLLHGGRGEHRHLLPDARSVHRPPLWPVLLVIVVAIGADLAQVGGLSLAPLALRMRSGPDAPSQHALSAHAIDVSGDDALLSSIIVDVPRASVEAITL